MEPSRDTSVMMTPPPHDDGALVYRLLGGPGSPFSLKMRAILRYRQIAHQWVVPRGYIGSEGELQRAGKRLLPVLQYPDGTYHADTTPMVYDLERRHPMRSVIPADAGQALISHLIEDFADEMLSTAMFDMRWNTAQDQWFCATRQISGWLSYASAEQMAQMVEDFIQRQTARRAQMVLADNHEILMQAYGRVLELLERLQETRPYLFGTRPSLGDFGLYGQLLQCAIDPTASEWMRRAAPRTFQWTQSLDDASGVEGEWAPGLPEPVTGLLQLIGSHYLPLLEANARAIEQGQRFCEVQVGPHRWRSVTDKYKYKCLAWLRREMVELDGEERDVLRPVLIETGCWDALNGPDFPVSEMRPL